VVGVFYTDEYGEWFATLTQEEKETTDHVVGLLEEFGLRLGSPYSSDVEGSEPYAFRELRPKKGQSPLRVIYAFDPSRDAVLIIGGDKGKESKFYERIIQKAKTIWKEYLAEHAAGKHNEE
jgi:hypothetical protein